MGSGLVNRSYLAGVASVAYGRMGAEFSVRSECVAPWGGVLFSSLRAICSNTPYIAGECDRGAAFEQWMSLGSDQPGKKCPVWLLTAGSVPDLLPCRSVKFGLMWERSTTIAGSGAW